MSFSPVRAAAVIASGVIASVGLAILAPAAQAAPQQPTEFDYVCDTVKVKKISGKPKHYTLTGTGNCAVHNQNPEQGTLTGELSVGPKDGDDFWTCEGAKVSVPDKVTSADCVVGQNR
ncbi:hypothetical protein OG203_23975 [Nocardia sp. NBC_01499]|uniref:hypothetical protein n=1 Tax=Nocardia sp. NBC_01499 TaxID=2903597 RepID=UPI0038647500